MSRIHEALKKAEAERRSSASGPEVPRELESSSASPAAGPAAPAASAPLSRLPDRQLSLARFSAEGEAVLSRSYDEIERFCSERLRPALRDSRVLLVTSLAPQASPGKVALALAATLVEQLRLSVVLVDCAGTDRGAAGFFETDHRGPGLVDLLRDPGQSSRCVRRTVLQGLYFLPVGQRPSANEPGRGDSALQPALERLQEACHLIVLAADSVSSDPRVVGLAGLAHATILVASDPNAAVEQMRDRLFVPTIRLYGIGELP
jgi:Mrp family chromosome partitioning ATPase